MSCGVGRRRGSDPALLWCRQAAAAPIRPLALEPPYAMSLALEKTKKKDVPVILDNLIQHNPFLTDYPCHRLISK